MLDKLFGIEERERRPTPQLPAEVPAGERTVFEVTTEPEETGESLPPLPEVLPAQEVLAAPGEPQGDTFSEDIEPATAPVITVSERQQNIAAALEAMIREAETAAAAAAAGPLSERVAQLQAERDALTAENVRLSGKLERLREALAA